MDLTALTEQLYIASKLPCATVKTYSLHLLSEDEEHESLFTLTLKQ